MNGQEFIRSVRALARKHGVAVVVDEDRGKGSHVILYYGTQRTVVQYGEIPKGTLKRMCKALKIAIEDL